MARYHITIKDNETGEITTDCETSCIIGAYHDDGDNNTATLVAIHCNGGVLAHTTYCAAKGVQIVQDKHPEVSALLALKAAMDKEGGDDKE